MLAVATKQCARCRAGLDVDAFALLKTGKLHSWCRPCVRTAQRERRNDPEIRAKTNADERARRATPEGKVRKHLGWRAWVARNQAAYMWQQARTRAARLGVPFDLSESDIFIPVCCPVLGVMLEPRGNGPATPNTASIDRVDNARGYVRGNVAVISLRANQLKNNATAAEHAAIAAWMRSHGAE